MLKGRENENNPKGFREGDRHFRRRRRRGTVLYVFDPTAVLAILLAIFYALFGGFGLTAQEDSAAIAGEQDTEAEVSESGTSADDSVPVEEESEATGVESETTSEETEISTDESELTTEESESAAGDSSSEEVLLEGEETSPSDGWTLFDDIASILDSWFGGDHSDEEASGGLLSFWNGLGGWSSDVYTGDYEGLSEPGEEHWAVDEENGIEYVDNTILVLVEDGLTNAQKESIALSVDGVVIGEYAGMAGLLQIEVEVSELTELEALSEKLEENELVWFAGYDFVLEDDWDDGDVYFDETELSDGEDTDEEMILVEEEEIANGEEPSEEETNNAKDFDAVTESDEVSQQGLLDALLFEIDGDWWRAAINVERAWEEFGDCFGSVLIGVVDNGIRTSQEDVEGKINFTSSIQETRNALAADEEGYSVTNHGTAVTSLIVADQDGSGVDGIADQATVYFSSYTPYTNVSNDQSKYLVSLMMMETMEQADAGCKVINHSSGLLSTAYSQEFVSYTAEVMGKLTSLLVSSGWDGLIVQAAGNEKEDTAGNGFWATYKSANSDLDDHILIVTGVEAVENDSGTQIQLDSEFAYGDAVDICAPGRDIEVPYYWFYYQNSGTSFAAPMVTATAGLIWSADPDMTAAEVKDCLVNGYRFELTSSVSGDTYPMLDVYNAVERALYCNMEGTVAYEDGTAAEGITVLAVDEEGETIGDALTDEEGYYVLSCNRLTVDHISFVRGEEEVSVLEFPEEWRSYDADAARSDDEEDYDPHDMEDVILPLLNLSVYVTDEDGVYLNDVQVTVQDAEGNSVEADLLTDEAWHSYYQLSLIPGSYEVQVHSDVYTDSSETVELDTDADITLVLSGIDVMDYLETFQDLVDLLDMELTFDWDLGAYFSAYERDGFYLAWDYLGEFSMMNGKTVIGEPKANMDVSVYGVYIGDDAEDLAAALEEHGWIYLEDWSYGKYRSYLLYTEEHVLFLEYGMDDAGNLYHWSFNNWPQGDFGLD